MSTTLRILFAGAFGAIAPNLVGMAQQALISGPDPEAGYLYARLGFWVGTLVFAVLGGGIAYLYGETNARRAIALGAGAPALVLGWAQGTGAKLSVHARAGDSAPAKLVVTAYAAERMDGALLQQRETLWVVVSGLTTTGPASDLVAVLPAAGAGPERLAFHLTPAAKPIAVPRSATEVYVLTGDAPSNRVSLSNVRGDTLRLEITLVNQSFWSGFKRAFGIRSVSPREPVIRVMP